MESRSSKLVRFGLQIYNQSCRRIHQTVTLNINPNNVKEVQIPVPWGHIAGKWWGDTSKQPILALHGWQDNAGTFDPLLELLPESFSVLAVDDPGHGLSSHFPEGMLYNFANYLIMCKRIQKYYNWTDPMNILAHSKGAVIGVVFSAIYPESVNALVAIDVIKPLAPSKKFYSKLGDNIDSTIIKMTRSAEKNKMYSLEEIEKRWIAGTKGSLTSEAVKILLKRGAQLDPVSGKYSLTRDPRVKIWNLSYFDERQSLAIASNVKCHLLAIRFTDGKFFDAPLKDSPSYLKTIENDAKSFKLVTIEGTHHNHLNNAKSVEPVITEFLERVMNEKPS
ncbi:probable serine hydrolase [Macrosteles quadrilineatus]|uniref:probable serine hydrolase n=1 Tax=Macrosteles quadrilineatus TaxID=74068 RepID=UPI0023E13930|nr:probable serine hydrolase [Macrosteles quadrilineatus]